MSWHEPGRDRDPWRDPEKGPPDLDEWFRRAWQRIRGRLSHSPRPGGSRRLRLWWIVPIVLIGIWLITGFYRVPDSHKAVTMRFGAFAGISGPGLHWHWPWPIGNQETVNLSIDRSISQHALVLAGDGKVSTVRLTVDYRISDPRKYIFGSSQPDVLVASLADAALARAAREQSLEDLRTNKTAELEQHLERRIIAGLESAQAGIAVRSVDIGHIEPPAAVTDETRQLAELMKSNQEALEKARAEAEDKVLAAGRKASTIIANAQQQAKAREALARIRLAHFQALLPAWQKAPATIRKVLRSELLFATLAELPKVVVSGSVHSVTLPPAAASAQTPGPSESGSKPAAAASNRGGSGS
ncbi:MAG: protease modulator HflK [Gammaproteobacteria bacterium]|nr:protease modulator HflK [Gammaproteobacteria bacterium]